MISVNPKRIRAPEFVARGLALQKAGQLDQARAVYNAILDKHPDHAVAKFLLALCYEAANEQVHALNLMDEVLRTKPSFTEAWYNRGVILQWLGRIPEARESYERTLRLNPSFAAAHTNLGNVMMALGDDERAIHHFDRATELRPDTTEGVHNRSFVYLLRGQWDRGWRDYELRWNLPGNVAPVPAGVPWWQGEPLEGKRIAIAHEQGYGDTFMALRYVPCLGAMGAQVTLCVPPEIEPICRASFPYAAVRTDGSWPDVDYGLPMMSLPSRFATTPDTVPFAGAPYLAAPETFDLPAGEGFPVAFAWRGSRDHKNDRNRSTRLSEWLPILAVPGIAWYCMQRDVSAIERQELAKLPGMRFVDTAGWGETAGALTALRDRGGALVSVDTGLVHLAGGLGVTTAALISALPDFRWMHQRSDTVWYPGTRLYRQPALGDWQTPIQEIAARLRAIVEPRAAA